MVRLRRKVRELLLPFSLGIHMCVIESTILPTAVSFTLRATLRILSTFLGPVLFSTCILSIVLAFPVYSSDQRTNLSGDHHLQI
jgi:hypothetical protein